MPLIFPWEKRVLEENTDIELYFTPEVVYQIGRDSYLVVLYRWIIKGYCPFLTKDGYCSIHDLKPASCKMFPLIYGWGDSSLRLSINCKWVLDNLKDLKDINPVYVFEEEFKVLIEIYSILSKLDKIAKSRNWIKMRYKDVKTVSKLVELNDINKYDD